MDAGNAARIVLVKHHIYIIVGQKAGYSSDIHDDSSIFRKMVFCT